METRHHIDPHVSHLSKLSGAQRAAYLSTVLTRRPALHAAILAHLRVWSPGLLRNHKDDL